MNKIFLFFAIVVACLIRLAPHPPNFTPILSIALFSGFIFRNKLGFILPMSIMVLTDFFIGNYQMSVWVYSSLFLIYFISKNYEKFNLSLTLKISVIGSFLFFIITNFGVWIVGYPKSFSGILACYYAALPFYKNTLLSTLAYSTMFYFVYELTFKYSLNYSKK